MRVRWWMLTAGMVVSMLLAAYLGYLIAVVGWLAGSGEHGLERL